MSLITLKDVGLTFGEVAILNNVQLQIERNERICLLGRNGAGKSTLIKLINQEIEEDEGEITFPQGTQTARLAQEVPQQLKGKVFEVITSELGEWSSMIQEYHDISHKLAEGANEKLLQKLQDIQQLLDADGGWERYQQVNEVLSILELDPDQNIDTLSGGLKRRVLLARALVLKPDVLLLDEPTNHLDITSIQWLEDFLLRYQGTVFFVTHDRAFLKKLATRIIELDRGLLTSWSCNYETYLERKKSQLLAEEAKWAQFDKKLAQEEVWLRKGIKARRTRNEGRVRALKKMREERSGKIEQVGKAKIQLQKSDRSGQLVIKAENLSYGYTKENFIFQNFSATIMRGDKVGIVGSNGSGKTTLLKTLLEKLTPQEGTVRHGTQLEIAYFDQLRMQLEEDKNVVENVGQGNESLTINGKPRNVMGYLQDFLFSPERARCAVRTLSGGERNRLMLAKLFAKPSNVLVMDEPTNDLDIETLELLEELLLDYKGSLLLVSHDRAFLNNVVTSLYILDGQGSITEFIGSYDDWILLQQEKEKAIKAEKSKKNTYQQKKEKERAKRLSYKEKRELQSIPERIEKLEEKQEKLHEKMGAPSFYQKDKEEIAKAKAESESLAEELQLAYERWEELEQNK